MSFDDLERSSYGGSPVSLYEFVLGEIAIRYSSDAEDTVVGGVRYISTAISDSGSVQSGDARNDDMTITLPTASELARLFQVQAPSEPIWVRIRNYHRDTDEAPIYWIGTVSSVKRTSDAATEVVCHMLTASFNRNGLRLSYGRQCPHALYDHLCRVPKANFATALQVGAVSGDAVTSSALATFPEGYFNNGFFEWVIRPGLIERRAISMSSDDWFTVLGTTAGLEIGDWILAYPGCSRTTNECLNKFNNLSNYGGFPQLPGKSPFDGTPVF